jgi:transcriptional regulator GlxA family with amidase domain
MKIRSLSLAFLVLVVTLVTTQTSAEQPQSAGPLKVAFVISEGFTLIDLAGPWDVFNSAKIPVADGDREGPSLFETYTVSATTSPVEIGLTHTKLTPDYTFQNAPKPDIIVVGAQDWRKEVPGLNDWLKKENSVGITVMSVCVGAAQLGDAGLLNGKQATTHHAFLKDFRKDYPKTTWQEGKRYVRSSDTVLTAGGLTSGIDLALYVVAQRFGENVAQKTAEWLEYTSDGWKQKE